jgi:hypothetical protein
VAPARLKKAASKERPLFTGFKEGIEKQRHTDPAVIGRPRDAGGPGPQYQPWAKGSGVTLGGI